MPTYVYECKSCSKQVEVEQRITEDPLTDCDCGAKNALVRLIQPTAVMFKGSGFYVNDTSSTATAPTETPSCTSEPASCPACTPASDSATTPE